MKTLTLCSAGPSLAAQLAEFPPPDGRADIVVNTAAALIDADWWACMDAHRFAEIEPIGPTRPTVVSFDDQLIRMQSLHAEKFKDYNSLDIKACLAEIGAQANWLSYSAVAALFVARRLRADEVVIYGMDMDGATCCVGQDMAKQRSEARWQQEKDVVRQVFAWMKNAGTQVRMIPKPTISTTAIPPDDVIITG